MSQENVEVLRQVFAAIADRDHARLVELTDPDVEWRSFFAALLPKGEYRGHDGLRDYLEDVAESWESLRPELIDALQVDDLVVGVGRIRYRGKESGVETDETAGWMLKFRDHRVIVFRAFRNPSEALESVGLSE